MQDMSVGQPDDLPRIEATLRSALFRFDCPGAQTLGEYELGLVEPEQRVAIAAHATECAECGAELRMLRVYLATPIQPPPVGVPAEQQLGGGDVRLLPASGGPLFTKLDEFGNFEFEGLAAGSHVLEIGLPYRVIVVEELRVE